MQRAVSQTIRTQNDRNGNSRVFTAFEVFTGQHPWHADSRYVIEHYDGGEGVREAERIIASGYVVSVIEGVTVQPAEYRRLLRRTWGAGVSS